MTGEKKDDFSKRQKSKSLENTLFSFYKSKIKDGDAFQLLLEEGLSYQFIAYLFFIKDSRRFMPISQERFDQIFELIGVPDFRTSGNASWDNYSTFNDIIKQVRNFLRIKDDNATLLDAHSFLWIIGSPIFQLRKSESSYTEAKIQQTLTMTVQTIEEEYLVTEEDEELTFPEGKEVFRLHRSKERNRELICAAKQKRIQIDKKLCCQICGFSFVDTYGELGDGFIEAHHIFPISQLTEETETKIDDLALVCSNCHRMLHIRRPWLALDELKTILQKQG
ncbi:MAG: HNH endonuclease [Sporocytophaga sp.]|nr:HNH endonuclease [Sporocytophaga sp.]